MVTEFNEIFSNRQLRLDVKVFPKFWGLTDVTSFGATIPPSHPEDEEGASSWNVGKPSHLDVAVCPKKFQCIVKLVSLAYHLAELQNIFNNYVCTKQTARLAVRYKVYY